MAAQQVADLRRLCGGADAVPHQMDDGVAAAQVVVELGEQGAAAVGEVLLDLDLDVAGGQRLPQRAAVAAELIGHAGDEDNTHGGCLCSVRTGKRPSLTIRLPFVGS
ncbi:hypothetical protein [uncultured Thiohalocapsa sp.]|uniref:hypothetical protein n=1 Tax=uncultured Thiohalocapsa sp. TaxID=768990 RepID=UPI0025D4D80B|nr:hypothetical protein [uncultured Thiohalocapsa sp.]